MSLAQPPLSDRTTSPLMSNNPFRNRVASATPPINRPLSTNPFLDATDAPKDQNVPNTQALPTNEVNGATELFSSMSMAERQGSPQRVLQNGVNGASRRPENIPPRSYRGPPPQHRSSTSEKQMAGPTVKQVELDIFADPPTSLNKSQPERHPRRNSESSIMDKSSSLDADEEKRRRERKYRESKRTGPTRQKPSKKLDIIDKLDVTSIYGTGLFHHDGPFDACNPHRNRRKHRLAPMQAFPKDSENMKIGGSGPVNSKLDYNKFHGYGQEAHIDFNEARQEQAVIDEDAAYLDSRAPHIDRATSFNATARVDPVHGRETAGLGTSTFLEGAPASRAAIQRRDSEFETQQQTQANGLSRKKSLVQKIRAVRPGGSGRVMSPDREQPPQSPPLMTGRSDSAVNPFFRDYDTEYERKGQQIAFAEEQIKPNRARAPSSPRHAPMPGLERQITTESMEGGKQETKPTGLLGRMKSLKKSKPRYERREPSQG